jgi:hypothetical protein
MRAELRLGAHVKICINSRCAEDKNLSLYPWASTACSALYTTPPLAPCAKQIERLDVLDPNGNVVKSGNVGTDVSVSVQQITSGMTGIIRVTYSYRDVSADSYQVLSARLVCKDANNNDLAVHLYTMASPVQKTSQDVLVVTWTIDLIYTIMA